MAVEGQPSYNTLLFWEFSHLVVSGVENESEILCHIEEDSVLGHSRMDSSESSISNRMLLTQIHFVFTSSLFLYPVWKFPGRKD